MKGVVTDPIVLRAVRPLDLTAYLRARGWRLDRQGILKPTSDWSKEGERGHFEIVAPRHSTWSDYPRRVREVVATLSEEEGRSELHILHDIRLASQDVVRLNAVVDGRDDGTIPLGDGALLARAARGMMLAAACSAVYPKRAYPPRKPTKATDYLNELSLGQTEHGSFVMTVLSPVPPGFVQGHLALPGELDPGDLDARSFNRNVTRTLANALHAVREATDAAIGSGKLDPFDEAVPLGVSADLCESLALVRDCRSVRHLNISLGWAAARPEPQNLVATHDFSPDYLEVVAEAGRLLRERAPVEAFELAGVVVSLDRPEDPLQGSAVVLAEVDAQPKRVRVALSGEDWQAAILSMRRRWAFRCEGELGREGNFYILRNARGVRVIPEGEE
jgi:hypothetical protein